MKRTVAPANFKTARCNLALSSQTFRACWMIITSYHVFNATFLAVMAWSHLFTASDTVYENLWLIQITQPTLRTAGYSYTVLSCVHWLIVIANIAQSIRQRRLTFGYDIYDGNDSANTFQNIEERSRRSTGVWETMRVMLAAPLDMWEKYFGMHGWFGVHGALFYVGFYMRQTVEILLQTYQAYMISRSLPSVWINQFVTCMIVINCLYAPVLSTVLARRVALRRILTLTLDICLDFAIAGVIPIVSLIPSLRQFDWSSLAFPLELVFNDVWITTRIMTTRQTMVHNPIDYISSMFPHLTGLAGLDTIKRIIQRASLQSGEARVTDQDTHNMTSPGANSVSPFASAEIKGSRTTRTDEQNHQKMTWAFYAFTVGWAIAVLVAHSKSSKTSTATSSCELRVNAWLAGKVSCAVANINCHRLGVSGSHEELASILNSFERPSLARMVFSHCAALRIPDVVNQFPNLLGITVFNSTLVDWPASGAMTASLTPKLVTVNFVDTNFTGSIPAALLHPELPASTCLAIYRSNLTELPRDIGERWFLHGFPTFVVEYTNLKEIPASFQHVLAYRLSLGRNHIEELPEAIFERHAIQRLRLSGNPLTKLPATIGNPAVLMRVWVEDTNVSDVPTGWIEWWAAASAPDRVFSLHGSPVCDDAALEVCQPAPARWRDEFPYDVIAAQYRLR